MSNSISLYITGGAGQSIMADPEYLNRLREKEVDIYVIDSHTEDVAPLGPNVQMHVISDEKGAPLRGGGANRAIIYPHIQRAMTVISDNMPFSDINILIGSGTGATGSTTIGVMVGEIIKAGKLPIVLLVTSEEALNQAENAVKSLGSLEGVSSLNKGNLAIMHWHCTTNQFAANNSLIRSSLAGLITLIKSGAFDFNDWKSFIRPSSETANHGVRPLVIDVNQLPSNVSTPVLSTLTLHNGEATETNPSLFAKFSSLDQADLGLFTNDPNVRTPITRISAVLGTQSELAKMTDELKKAIDRKKKSIETQSASSISIKTDGADETGMII